MVPVCAGSPRSGGSSGPQWSCTGNGPASSAKNRIKAAFVKAWTSRNSPEQGSSLSCPPPPTHWHSWTRRCNRKALHREHRTGTRAGSPRRASSLQAQIFKRSTSAHLQGPRTFYWGLSKRCVCTGLTAGWARQRIGQRRTHLPSCGFYSFIWKSCN